ncbi:MAG: N-acyl homoserine lactonase family protein [Lachnospiraceae bacterium]|jgi:N-acyl homoserine lactone hydrolase|nr:N-acyl homoserine lactonase family protein [Lachnospiraceae bacterium]
MKEYTITPINTGLVTASRSNYLYHNTTHKHYLKPGEDDVIKLPVACFLVQGDGKKIMIDTGMSSTAIADKYHHPGSVQPEGYAVHEQLEKLGVGCEEITDIIYTHLHWDHVYYTPMFKNAKLYAQRKEYEFAKNPIPLYYKSYEDPRLNIEPRIHPQWEGREFVLLDGACEVLDGIRVYLTPGHSVGHQTVVVHTKEGDFHCCGDLIFTYDNIKPVEELGYEITPPSRFVNIAEEWNSIVELRDQAGGQEFILPTHAPEMLDLIASGRVIGA